MISSSWILLEELDQPHELHCKVPMDVSVAALLAKAEMFPLATYVLLKHVDWRCVVLECAVLN